MRSSEEVRQFTASLLERYKNRSGTKHWQVHHCLSEKDVSPKTLWANLEGELTDVAEYLALVEKTPADQIQLWPLSFYAVEPGTLVAERNRRQELADLYEMRDDVSRKIRFLEADLA